MSLFLEDVIMNVVENCAYGEGARLHCVLQVQLYVSVLFSNTAAPS